jgi:hypothetical protein
MKQHGLMLRFDNMMKYSSKNLCMVHNVVSIGVFHDTDGGAGAQCASRLELKQLRDNGRLNRKMDADSPLQLRGRGGLLLATQIDYKSDSQFAKCASTVRGEPI